MKTKTSLESELATIDLLSLIATRTKKHCQEFIMDLDMLGNASLATCVTIRFCQHNVLISVCPTGSHQFDFSLTQKGRSYLKDNKLEMAKY